MSEAAQAPHAGRQRGRGSAKVPLIALSGRFWVLIGTGTA